MYPLKCQWKRRHRGIHKRPGKKEPIQANGNNGIPSMGYLPVKHYSFKLADLQPHVSNFLRFCIFFSPILRPSPRHASRRGKRLDLFPSL